MDPRRKLSGGNLGDLLYVNKWLAAFENPDKCHSGRSLSVRLIGVPRLPVFPHLQVGLSEGMDLIPSVPKVTDDEARAYTREA